jgi:hypothetical protein
MVATFPPNPPTGDEDEMELPDILLLIAKEVNELEQSGAPTESILAFLTTQRASALPLDVLLPLARGFLYEIHRRSIEMELPDLKTDSIAESLRRVADAIESGEDLDRLP